MRRFYNFKVRTKLIAAFIFVALLAGMIGYFGRGGVLPTNNLKFMIGLTVIGLVAALWFGLFIARGILVPIAKVVEMVQEMERGHLGKRLKMVRNDEIGVLANTMDQFADDLQNNVVAVLHKIAAGDLSLKVTPKDSADEIALVLKKIFETLREIVAETGLLPTAALEGKLETRGNADKFQGGWQALIVGVNNMIEAFVAPITATAGCLDRIAQGDVPENMTTEYNGEFNTITHNLNQCIDTISNLMAETSMLTDAAVAGNLSARGDVSKFQGDFAWIVQGFNNTLDAVVRPLNVAAEYVDRIAKGDLPEKIAGEYKGDFNAIKINLNSLIDNLQELITVAHAIANGDMAVQVNKRSENDELVSAFQDMMASITYLIQEMHILTEAALDGKLDVRGNIDKFQGDFARIIQGVNATLDAVISPLNVAAEYVARIAQGDIPEPITDDYKGDFNEIKNNLNQCIEAVNGIVLETGRLTAAAVAGQLVIRGNADMFQGNFAQIVQGVNDTLDAVIWPLNLAADYVERIAKGDLPAPITDEHKGDFNVIKQNLNSLIESMHAITRVAEAIAEGNVTVAVNARSDQDRLMKALQGMITVLTGVLQEMETLTQTVQAGKLNARGNVESLKGGWQALVAGVNHLIEAFVEPITATAGYLDRIAKGDVPENMTTEYQGEFNTIKHNLNQCIDAISGLMAETSRLTDAAVEGNLSARGDVHKFQGDFAWIIQGVNNTLDAVVRPLTVAAEYVDRIAKGDLPEKITDEYKGDFNAIKQNLNSLIEAMHDITRMAEAIAAGNLMITVQERSDQDRLMNALNDMINALNGVVLVAEAIAGGDLMADVKARSDQDRLMNALKMMITRLNEVLINVKAAADNVASGSQAMSSSAEEMSQGTTEQSAAAEEASASMEQMVANIRQNADNAKQTEQIALKAAEDARKSGEAVSKTVIVIQEIAKKIGIIEEIARETRMLSLNATIEAAKAQDYGKGFAVVASEVRALAERSRIAAAEINDLAHNSVTVAEQAGDLLAKLVPDIQKTAELVQEISAASSEQNTGAEQINRAIQQLDSVIQQNSATSEEMAATSEELASQAEQLQQTIGFFRIAETAWQPLEQGDQMVDAAHLKPVAGADALVREKQIHKGVKKDTGVRGDRTPAVGSALNIGQRDQAEDDLDAEFERY